MSDNTSDANNMTEKEIIPVVAACIESYDGRRLLLHRKTEAADEKGMPRNPELCGKWEFPGGMVKYAEEPTQALHREILEELGQERILIGRIVDARTHIFRVCIYYLVIYYLCNLLDEDDLEGQCPRGGRHDWGIDGAHSNRFCKKCFADQWKGEPSWFTLEEIKKLDAIADTYRISWQILDQDEE